MSTLADMTEEERAQCRGMWAQTQDELGVLLTTDGVLGAVWIPHAFNWLTQPVEAIELLTDLPRAWQSDGKPPAGEWEHAEYLGDYKGMTNVYYFDGEPTHRRWKGEWEEA